jgi:hypothetical protein
VIVAPAAPSDRGRQALSRVSAVWYHRNAMVQRLVELIGRAMIDPDFLGDLQRAPEVVLAQYELNDEERTTVLGALARLRRVPAGERAQEFRTALIRRVAT